MIITDVEWRGGVPVRFQVAEANYGGGWMNPSGQIPWERTVNVGRLVAPGYKIVSFEHIDSTSSPRPTRRIPSGS